MIDFREKHPIRTCNKKYKTYRSYKPYLAKDFNNRCGYTDCPDFWFGGSGTFHIDHFIAQAKGSDSDKIDYENLVYSCSYVNILKSDDDGRKYLDPCKENLNEHFYRNNSGEIFPKEDSSKAKYMYNRLKLYLLRYSIIWKLEKICERMEKLSEINVAHLSKSDSDELNSALADLARSFSEYKKYLSRNQ